MLPTEYSKVSGGSIRQHSKVALRAGQHSFDLVSRRWEGMHDIPEHHQLPPCLVRGRSATHHRPYTYPIRAMAVRAALVGKLSLCLNPRNPEVERWGSNASHAGSHVLALQALLISNLETSSQYPIWLVLSA